MKRTGHAWTSTVSVSVFRMRCRPGWSPRIFDSWKSSTTPLIVTSAFESYSGAFAAGALGLGRGAGAGGAWASAGRSRQDAAEKDREEDSHEPHLLATGCAPDGPDAMDRVIQAPARPAGPAGLD